MAESIDIDVAGVRRTLPISAIPDAGIRIAFLDILGDVGLIDAATRELAARLGTDTFDVILGGDTVGLVMAHHLSLVTGHPYVCARKKRTPQMREPLTAQAQSVAATSVSTFYLDARHAEKLAGADVVVIDEVCSTGSTLNALASIARTAGATSVRTVVVATEGEERDDVMSLVHLPVWID